MEHIFFDSTLGSRSGPALVGRHTHGVLPPAVPAVVSGFPFSIVLHMLLLRKRLVRDPT